MNSTIRLEYTFYYPFINTCADFPNLLRPSANCLMPGMIVEFMGILVKHLNLTIEAKLFPPDVTFENNLEKLSNGTIDLFSYPVEGSTTLYNQKLFEFTLPLYFSETKLIVRRAEHTMDGFFDLFMIYDKYIWIVIGLMFVIFCAYGIFIRLIGNWLKFKFNYGIVDFVWRITRLHFLQDDSFEFRKMSANFSLIVFVLFQCGLTIRMYNNIIKTSALRTINPTPFQYNEIFKILRERKFKLIAINKFDWWYRETLFKSEPPFRELRDATKNNPILLAKDMKSTGRSEEKVLSEVDAGGKIAFLQDDSQMAFQADLEYCDFVYLKSPLPPKPQYLIMRRNNPLLPLINEVINREYVHFVKIHKKYMGYKRPSKCHQQNFGPKPLTLSSYYGVIMFTAIGISIGLIAFFVELYVFKRRNK